MNSRSWHVCAKRIVDLWWCESQYLNIDAIGIIQQVTYSKLRLCVSLMEGFEWLFILDFAVSISLADWDRVMPLSWRDPTEIPGPMWPWTIIDWPQLQYVIDQCLCRLLPRNRIRLFLYTDPDFVSRPPFTYMIGHWANLLVISAPS